ncbi:class I adenylate-forming enzyme family protein [Catenuloplanes atrovinosus]|uniref:Long-chain acyl-CoA synthetase n=1 Tax=Catenuloplanes atrovinosus TaxID=137266 RepID=A0AAE4CAJ9_9ACTN|nr:AMP-binding protein [Catenuloplanes atrovinosus]MDR7274680.1 long-chain acyl-CoA synthetase [Catenuloplanes atrovinosus]
MDVVNLARLFETARERHGDYPAIRAADRWYSSGELFDRAVRFSAGLRALGVKPGDRVVVFMANCPEVVISYHAIWRAGAVVTPIVFLVTPAELRHMVDDSGAVAVITTAELVPKVTAALTGLDLPVIVDLAPHETTPGPLADRGEDELAALLYTGGTTGRSKGVALTHANIDAASSASRQVSFVPGISRSVTALPLSHSYGMLVTVGTQQIPEPESTVLLRFFDAPAWLRVAEQHRVQQAAVVPSMLAMLLAEPLEDFDLSSLRNVFSGAAPLPRAVAEEFTRRVPSVQILEGYGCTETAGILTSTPPGRARPGTVGLPVPGVSLRLVDFDDSPVPPGEPGEIVASGPNVMSAYWDGTRDFTPDGWLRTGDVGTFDDDGYLSIIDRKKDVIIRGGYNVYPRDVEEALIRHPAVTGCAVVGRPDNRLGEEVVAMVTVSSPLTTPEDLIEYAKTVLSANKYPREIRIVEAIPLTSVGKVDRKRLRAGVTSGS